MRNNKAIHARYSMKALKKSVIIGDERIYFSEGKPYYLKFPDGEKIVRLESAKGSHLKFREKGTEEEILVPVNEKAPFIGAMEIGHWKNRKRLEKKSIDVEDIFMAVYSEIKGMNAIEYPWLGWTSGESGIEDVSSFVEEYDNRGRKKLRWTIHVNNVRILDNGKIPREGNIVQTFEKYMVPVYEINHEVIESAEDNLSAHVKFSVITKYSEFIQRPFDELSKEDMASLGLIISGEEPQIEGMTNNEIIKNALNFQKSSFSQKISALQTYEGIDE